MLAIYPWKPSKTACGQRVALVYFFGMRNRKLVEEKDSENTRFLKGTSAVCKKD